MPGTQVETFSQNGPIAVVTLTLVADDTTAEFINSDLTTKFSGRLVCLLTNPGATGPQSNYDIVLNNADGIDVLKGAGANRHTSNSEHDPVEMNTNNRVGVPVAAEDTLTLVLSNNNVNSAEVVIKLYIEGVLRVDGQ